MRKDNKKIEKNTKTPSGMTGFLSAVSSRGVPAPESKHPDIADIHRHGSHGLPHARPSGFLDSAFGFARNDRTMHDAQFTMHNCAVRSQRRTNSYVQSFARGGCGLPPAFCRRSCSDRNDRHAVTLSGATAKSKGLDTAEHSPARRTRVPAGPTVGIPRLRLRPE